MLYAILGFISFPTIFWTGFKALDLWYEWRYKEANYKKCPTCSTYVLNLKAA